MPRPFLQANWVVGSSLLPSIKRSRRTDTRRSKTFDSIGVKEIGLLSDTEEEGGHENNVMFRDTDILPDDTYTHVNNGSQTCSWLDHIAMSECSAQVYC